MKKEDKDELIKSLEGLFTEEEIQALIEKAEIEGKFEDKDDDDDEKEKKDGDDKTVDEEAQENMKKAYDEIMSKKSELDKSIDAFCDKFGNVPGFTKPTDFFVKKSEETDIEKSEKVDIEKAFDSKFDEIQKSFDNQLKEIDELKKSMEVLVEDVKKFAEAPNPLKSLMGKYQFIEKGDKDDKDNLSLSKDKSKVIDLFVKSLDKIEDIEDQGLVRNMISDYTISNKTNTTGLNIVKKAMNIDFEK